MVDNNDKGNEKYVCDGCCKRQMHQTTFKETLLICTAVVLLSVGLAFVCLGYTIPQNNYFDSSVSAKETKDMQVADVQLSFFFNMCIVIGIGLIAVGGFTATIISVFIVVKRKQRLYRAEDRQDLTLLTDSSGVVLTSYGTTTDKN